MKVNFDYKQYLGVYNKTAGILTVINVYTYEKVSKKYSSKYTAKRGFERIVRKMLTARELRLSPFWVKEVI